VPNVSSIFAKIKPFKKMAQNREICTIMNNQDKNTYVKQQITTTLLELLKEKELSDINIGEITKKAQ